MEYIDKIFMLAVVFIVSLCIASSCNGIRVTKRLLESECGVTVSSWDVFTAGNTIMELTGCKAQTIKLKEGF